MDEIILGEWAEKRRERERDPLYRNSRVERSRSNGTFREDDFMFKRTWTCPLAKRNKLTEARQ